VRTQFVCKKCGHYVCKGYMWMILLVTLARIRMKLKLLISCVVFPTLLLLLQNILSYLHP